MKKSKAIEILNEFIVDNSGDIDGYQLLIKLNLMGFKPPCSCYGDPERFKEKGYGPKCGISWHNNEWEEE